MKENFRIGSSSASNSTTLCTKGAMKSIRIHVLKIQSGLWALGQDSSQIPLNTQPPRSVLRFLNKPNVVVSMSAFALQVPQVFSSNFGFHILWNVSRKKLIAYDDVMFLSLTSCRFMERTAFRLVLLPLRSGRTMFRRRQRTNGCTQKYSAKNATLLSVHHTKQHPTYTQHNTAQHTHTHTHTSHHTTPHTHTNTQYINVVNSYRVPTTEQTQDITKYTPYFDQNVRKP